MNSDVELSIQQFVRAWQHMFSGVPRSIVASENGIEYILSGLPVAFLNTAIPTQPGISEASLRALAIAACARASSIKVPWLFVLTRELLDESVDAAAVLDDCGLTPMMTLTGMRADYVAPALQIPDGLDLQTPPDDAGCSAIIDVNAAAYGMDLDSAKDVLGKRAFWENQFPIVGYTDGKPATAACVLMVDGYRYVTMVATDPDHWRRGFADAALRRALEDANHAHGDRITVLHATAAGRPIYERMGYRPIADHTIFMEKRFLAAN